MRILTIQQPWAELIANGEKWVENRCWDTPYRGLVAIHAGKSTKNVPREERDQFTFGAIVAVAHLKAIYDDDTAPDAVLDHEHSSGPFYWVLDQVQRLAEPVPCGGALGLNKLNPDLEAAVRRQLVHTEEVPHAPAEAVVSDRS